MADGRCFVNVVDEKPLGPSHTHRDLFWGRKKASEQKGSLKKAVFSWVTSNERVGGGGGRGRGRRRPARTKGLMVDLLSQGLCVVRATATLVILARVRRRLIISINSSTCFFSSNVVLFLKLSTPKSSSLSI